MTIESRRSQPERERRVEVAKLVGPESVRVAAEPAQVHRPEPIDEDPGSRAGNRDLRSKARGGGTRRGRGDDHRVERQEPVRLHDQAAACAELLPPASPAGGAEGNDLAARRSAGGSGAISSTIPRAALTSARLSGSGRDERPLLARRRRAAARPPYLRAVRTAFGAGRTRGCARSPARPRPCRPAERAGSTPCAHARAAPWSSTPHGSVCFGHTSAP